MAIAAAAVVVVVVVGVECFNGNSSRGSRGGSGSSIRGRGGSSRSSISIDCSGSIVILMFHTSFSYKDSLKILEATLG